MTAERILSRLLGDETPASAEEIALIDQLREACAERDRAEAHVKALLTQIRDLQQARRRQMTAHQGGN